MSKHLLNYTSLNKDIIKIIQSYNLPSLEFVKNNNKIKNNDLYFKTYNIYSRLGGHYSYTSTNIFYNDLLDTKIINKYHYFRKKYWTIEKIS